MGHTAEEDERSLDTISDYKNIVSALDEVLTLCSRTPTILTTITINELNKLHKQYVTVIKLEK